MGPQDYIDHENAKSRRKWLDHNAPAIAICFAIAIGADQVDNTINKRIIAPLTGTPVNTMPYTTQLAKKAFYSIKNSLSG